VVDNACKYGAPAGGHAPEHPIRFSASVTPDYVRLAVEDDGPGIPPALAERIFRPFERAGRDESDPFRASASAWRSRAR
jgi:signal transduction histidine kinase